jgi:tetratricopeptide (TPR) repeat protein
LPWLATRIIYGFHQSEHSDFHQLALSMQPTPFLQLFAGMQDFESEHIAAGMEWQWQNLVLSTGYQFESREFWLTSSFRLGLSSREQARKAMDQARVLLSQGEKRKAYRYGRLALAYDEENEQARTMMENLIGSVLNADVVIDSMLNAANSFAAKRWFLSAAAQYHRVLKLDPENKRAREAMALIKAQVDQHIDRWYQLGMQYVQQEELATAREVFEAILLVRPDHEPSRIERDKINQIFYKQAEESYYEGLGFYSQKNWDPAEEAFKKALELRPDWAEAQSYLWHVRQQKNQAEEELGRRWKEAEALKAKGDWLAARRAYKAVLDIDAEHAGAKAGLDEAQAHLTVYVNQLYSRAEAMYRNGDTENAKRLFTELLEFNSNHAGARRYLEAITTSLSLPLQRLWERARAYANANDWSNCLQSVDSLLQAKPQMTEALQLRRRIFTALTADQLVDLARKRYLQSQYVETSALAMEALKKNPNHFAAQNLYSQSQKRITAQVDEWFNRGIKLYTEEKYRSAIAEWDKVLAVNPDHEGAKDYKRRAQERMDALNRLP